MLHRSWRGKRGGGLPDLSLSKGVRLCEGRRWDIIGANHQCLPGRSRYIRLAEENVKGGKSYDPRKY